MATVSGITQENMRISLVIGIAAALVPPGLVAQSMQVRELGEGLEVGASVGAAQVRNDNFYYQPTNEVSVDGLLLSPALLVKQRYGRAITSLDVAAQVAEFGAIGDADNYVDSQVLGSLAYDGGVRSAFKFGAGYRRGHDPFGLDRTAGALLVAGRELDEWSLASVDTSYRYGARSALYNLEFQADYRVKDYTTNEPVTDSLDYGKLALSQTLFINYSPKTSFVLELSEDFVTFDVEPPVDGARDRDATELRARTGVRWEATAKTRGDIRLGATRRRLDDSRVDAVTGLSWQASVTWEPSSRTAFTVETSRRSQESFSTDFSVLDNRRHSVSLSHGWTRSFRTALAAGVERSRFVGAASGREDDIENYRFSAFYAFKNSLSVYLEMAGSERESNVNGRDFQTTTATVGIRVSP